MLAGLALGGLAALDWAGYTGFLVSLDLAMNELRETVVDTGPYSFVILGVAAMALVLGVVACVLGHRRQVWTGLPGQLAAAAVSMVLLASGFVVAARKPGDPLSSMNFWRAHVSQRATSRR